MRWFRFVLLIVLVHLAGCSSKVSDVGLPGVSISRRGESLKATESAPQAVSDPVILPAADPEDEVEPFDESVVAEDIHGCNTYSNIKFEGVVVDLVNSARQFPLEVLDEHALLTQIARQHSQEMACLDFFDHHSPLSGTVEERIDLNGYEYIAIGEVIATGYDAPEYVVAAWLGSQYHRENLLSNKFVHLGVGYAKQTGDDQPSFWTVVLASPKMP
jgi:uncharacterized protein YkwD